MDQHKEPERNPGKMEDKEMAKKIQQTVPEIIDSIEGLNENCNIEQ